MKRVWPLWCVLTMGGCAGPATTLERWDQPTFVVCQTWQARAEATQSLAYLATADYRTPLEEETFTLELFYRAPQTYLLRGRGTLGATGFNACIDGDSLTLLLNRERRGWAGPIGDYPDSALAEVWRLLQMALPWLSGRSDPCAEARLAVHVRLAHGRTRPEAIQVRDGTRSLELKFGRFRSAYPYWHLNAVHAASGGNRISLTLRQRLHNPALDAELFHLVLPAGTRPLTD